MGARSSTASGVPLNGTGTVAALTVTGDQAIGGNETVTGNVTLIGKRIDTPSASQTLTASTAILANAATVKITSAGIIISTAAPLMADGVDGQVVRILNVGANSITFSDQGLLASSNVRLTGNTLALLSRQSMELTYIASVGDWIQTGPLIAVL